MPNKQSTTHTAQSAAEQLAVTIDLRTGRIVKLEGLNAAGDRHELSDDEKATLVERRREKTLERLVERAFEAGIACVLDGPAEGEETSEAAESPEDVDLTHRLLVPLIEHSAAKDLMRRDVVDRTILDTLIEHSLSSSTPESAVADLR